MKATTIPDHNTDLIRALEVARLEDSLSQAKLAKAIGYDSGTINKFINRKYLGDIESLEAAVRNYLENRDSSRRLKSSVVPSSVVTRITGAINLARITGDKESNISIVSGPAGCGKTTAAQAYLSNNSQAILATLTDQHRDGKGVARAILAALPNSRYQRPMSVWTYLVTRLKGSKRPLIIDNAQRLNSSGRAWIFDFQDLTGIPIILIGNPETLAPIEANDQFSSRFGFHEAVSLQDQEISQLAFSIASQFVDFADEIRDLIAHIARNRGGLRAVKKQCLLAQALRDQGIGDPRDAFRAAHERLLHAYKLPN